MAQLTWRKRLSSWDFSKHMSLLSPTSRGGRSQRQGESQIWNSRRSPGLEATANVWRGWLGREWQAASRSQEWLLVNSQQEVDFPNNPSEPESGFSPIELQTRTQLSHHLAFSHGRHWADTQVSVQTPNPLKLWDNKFVWV